jgi:hypothetical protein
MNSYIRLILLSGAAWLPLSNVSGAQPVHTQDPFLGEWVGSFINTPKDYRFHLKDCYARIIPLGEGTCRVDLKPSLDERAPRHFDVIAAIDGDTLLYASAETQLTVRHGKMKGAVRHKDEWVEFALERRFRFSPTLGQPAPAGAQVLFDGRDFDAWQAVDERIAGIPWKIEGDAMVVVPKAKPTDPPTNLRTKDRFTDVFLHIEFMTPLEPEKRGQGRGNSGLFFQNRYEVQVLDSFGLEGLWNECGSIYEIAAPRINMCFPPEQWQTYDIIFRAPRFDPNGEKTQDAVLTVYQNGKRIHHEARVPKPTIGDPSEETGEPGYIWMQDHSHPVRFRNIWLIDLAAGGTLPAYLIGIELKAAEARTAPPRWRRWPHRRVGPGRRGSGTDSPRDTDFWDCALHQVVGPKWRRRPRRRVGPGGRGCGADSPRCGGDTAPTFSGAAPPWAPGETDMHDTRLPIPRKNCLIATTAEKPARAREEERETRSYE